MGQCLGPCIPKYRLKKYKAPIENITAFLMAMLTIKKELRAQMIEQLAIKLYERAAE